VGVYLSQDPIGLWGGFQLYNYVTDTNTWTDQFGLLSEFGIAPYGSSAHAKDGYEAHELLQNKWLEEHGHATRGSGLSRQNPAIAISRNPLHQRINDLQREAGLYDSNVISRQSAIGNINANARIYRQAMTEDLIRRGMDPKMARSYVKSKTKQLRRQAIAFAKRNNLKKSCP
jgi:uncharacterized protein RhaS with RHS repeats